jgi:hypothetical protein
MIAYFAMRIVGGVVTFFLVGWITWWVEHQATNISTPNQNQLPGMGVLT